MPAKHAHFFIPVFLDTESFLILRERILQALPPPWQASFHLLDDTAGQDPEVAKARSLPDVSVVTMPYNFGHQRALVHGLREFLTEGRPDCLIVTMDADGEDRPEDLPALLSAWEKQGDQSVVVLAKRTKREETIFFKVFYHLYKRVFRFLTGTVIQTGNYAVYHSSVASRILNHPYFELSYASTLFALGSRLVFVPCPRGVRYKGHSRMNFSRLAIHGVRMLMPFMDRIAIRGVLGFAFLTALSAAACLALAACRVLDLYPVPNWAVLSVVLLFVMSFLSVCNFVILITIFANVQGMAMARAGKAEKPE